MYFLCCHDSLKHARTGFGLTPSSTCHTLRGNPPKIEAVNKGAVCATTECYSLLFHINLVHIGPLELSCSSGGIPVTGV